MNFSLKNVRQAEESQTLGSTRDIESTLNPDYPKLFAQLNCSDTR